MKQESIVRKLFKTYFFWISICMVIILTGTILYAGYAISRNTARTQEQLTMSMNRNIETYFQEMDDFSMELVRNEAFRNTALRRLPEAYGKGQSTVDLFSELYQQAYKIIQKKYQIGIVLDEDYYAWMGDEYFIREIGWEKPDTYEDYPMDGSRIVQYLEQNEFLKSSMPNRTIEDMDSPKIVLSRSFGEEGLLHNGDAILEIMVDEEDFLNDMGMFSSEKSNAGFHVYIFNNRRDKIFSDSDWNARAYLDEINWETGTFYKNFYYAYIYRVFNSDFYVIYTISFFSFYRGLFTFVGIVLVFFLALVLLMARVSYRISRQISKPIQEICHELQKVNLEQGVHYQPVETDVRELDYLSRTIGELNGKLEESLRHIVMLKEFETHSKMMALQAQMQPHFLVNTLMTMGSMAQEAGNREVAGMCMNLTQMFRYISSEDSQGVRMFEEMKHIRRYVDIMRERFPNAQVELDIPMEMMDVLIPKLTIQPLVENSFKYCNRTRPQIYVEGRVLDNGRWVVQVSDNGAGFSEEKRKEILDKCLRSMEGVNSLAAKIDGMGLVNVYVRLHLFYREDAIYEIYEKKIEIGGNMS